MSNSIRILAVDVGTGTQDILLFESDKTIENCFKMVMPSPTVIIAERIKRATERGQPTLIPRLTERANCFIINSIGKDFIAHYYKKLLKSMQTNL